MDVLCENLDGVLIHDPENEYDKLNYTQLYSCEELNLARETVIDTTITRYHRYIKYIKFDVDDTSKYIKNRILQILSCKKNEILISNIKEIDRVFISYINQS